MGESAEIASLRAEIEALKMQIMSMRSDMDVSGGTVSSSGTGGPATGGYGTPWAIPDGYRLPGGAGGDGLHPYKVRVDGSGTSRRYMIYFPDPAHALMADFVYCDPTDGFNGSYVLTESTTDPGWYELPFTTGDVWLHVRHTNFGHVRDPDTSAEVYGIQVSGVAFMNNQQDPSSVSGWQVEYSSSERTTYYDVKIAGVDANGEVTQLVKSMVLVSPGLMVLNNATGIELTGSLQPGSSTGEASSYVLHHEVELDLGTSVVDSSGVDIPMRDFVDALAKELGLGSGSGDSDDSDESDGPPFEVEPKSGLVLDEPVIDGDPYTLDLAGRAALNNGAETFGIRKIVMHEGYTASGSDPSVYVLGCNHFPANGVDVWPKGIISVEGSGKISVSGPDENGKVVVSFNDDAGGDGEDSGDEPVGSDDYEELVSDEKRVVIGAKYDLSTHQFTVKYATVTVENGLITGWTDDEDFDTRNPVFTATEHAPEEG